VTSSASAKFLQRNAKPRNDLVACEFAEPVAVEGTSIELCVGDIPREQKASVEQPIKPHQLSGTTADLNCCSPHVVSIHAVVFVILCAEVVKEVDVNQCGVHLVKIVDRLVQLDLLQLE
jgi:hypothetical protein